MMRTTFVAAAMAVIGLAGGADAQALGIGAGAQGSQNYALNAGLVNLLSEKAGLDIRLQSFGGTGASIPLIQAGRLDMQAIVGPSVYSGYLGQDPFPTEMTNLRVIGSLGPSNYGFFVPADSEYRTVADVEGLRISYGFTSQPSLTDQVDGILANSGLTIDDMEPVLVPSVPNGADDLIAGNNDVVFFALSGGKVREADAAIGIRWLQMNDDETSVAAMQEHVPGSYVQTIEPDDGLVGLDGPTKLMAYDYLMVVGAHLDDDTVYEITKAIAENQEDMRAIGRSVSRFDAAEMGPALPQLQYHPGAERYLREAGLWQGE